jgi:tetratricopeptide (TPR) repeat protein
MDESEVKYRELLDSLEKRVQEGSVALDDLMELGHLYIYYNREHDAIKIFEMATELHPTKIITKVWLADTLLNLPECRLYVDRAMMLADDIINAGGEMAAAGYILKDWAIDLRRMSHERKDFEESISIMKKAAESAPLWPNVNQHLLSIYKNMGRYGEAIVEAQMAIDKIVDPIPYSSLTRYHFEAIITGRWSKNWITHYKQEISELQELIDKKRKDSELKMSKPPTKTGEFRPTRLWRSIIKIFGRNKI